MQHQAGVSLTFRILELFLTPTFLRAESLLPFSVTGSCLLWLQTVFLSTFGPWKYSVISLLSVEDNFMLALQEEE